MSAQATGHIIPDLETSSQILRNQAKNDEFLKETDNW